MPEELVPRSLQKFAMKSMALSWCVVLGLVGERKTQKVETKIVLLLCNISALFKNCFDKTLETYKVAETTLINENKAWKQWFNVSG